MSTTAAAARAPEGSARVSATLGAGWRACVDAAWLDGWEPQPFDLGDGITDVVVMGDGPTVLLLPPIPGCKEAWIACAGRLARQFRIVTFDLRDRFPGRPDWRDLLADLDRVWSAFASGPVAVVGHSLGGALAQQWALEHPERVRALVLSSTFARVTNPAGNLYARFIEQPVVVASQRLLARGPAIAVARLLARHGRWVYDARCDDSVLELVRFTMRDTRGATARALVRLAFAHDTRASAAHIACPTLVVVGERESVFSRPASEALARAIPGATLSVLPGVSHLHPLSAAEEFAERVSGWLEAQQ